VLPTGINSPNVGGCGGERQSAPVAVSRADQGGDTVAHETGHGFGRMHAPCPPTPTPGPPANVDPNWPNDTNPSAQIGEVGVRWDTQTVYPATSPDFMSYCGDRWISTYTYKGLLAAITSAAQITGAQGGEMQPHLRASGQVVEGQVELSRPFWVLPQLAGGHDGLGKGPYSIELQDAAGAPLFVRHFDPQDPYDGTEPDEGSFWEWLPFRPETRRIVFRRGDAVVGERTVSARPPEATLLSPNGGENWEGAGPFAITWLMSDPDGDEVTARLLYSADRGESWKPLAGNLTSTTFELDASVLPGSEAAIVRLLVSDGVLTSTDENDMPFRVGRKAPLVFLLEPPEGARLAPGQPVYLTAAATDPEDGPLTGEAFAWSSDVDGPLGLGTDLILDGLSPGAHRLTVRASDSDGVEGTASVNVFAGSSLYLPVILIGGW